MKLRLLLFALALATLADGTAAAQSPIVGVVSIIDGDTLEIHGQRIRLHGIDSPESGQFCEKDSKQYRCGQQASLDLADKIGRATVRCEQRDIDHYKRIVAVCSLGNLDLNAWMVRQGRAIAYRQYSRDYVGDENAARAARAGMWAGRFVEPSRWRRGDRLAAEKTEDLAAGSCQIKGERWFCSEEEALKAGWRGSAQ